MMKTIESWKPMGAGVASGFALSFLMVFSIVEKLESRFVTGTLFSSEMRANRESLEGIRELLRVQGENRDKAIQGLTLKVDALERELRQK
jgi:hypothetical protein